MYLLKLYAERYQITIIANSHSTMYLLKPQTVDFTRFSEMDSHSTMYLLKLGSGNEIFKIISFTFHHVSIKTRGDTLSDIAAK